MLAKVEQQVNVQFQQQATQVARTAASTITALWPKQKRRSHRRRNDQHRSRRHRSIEADVPAQLDSSRLRGCAAGVAQIKRFEVPAQAAAAVCPVLAAAEAARQRTADATKGRAAEVSTLILQGGMLFSVGNAERVYGSHKLGSRKWSHVNLNEAHMRKTSSARLASIPNTNRMGNLLKVHS